MMMSQEFEHRLINGLQLISSLLSMQGRAAASPEAAVQLNTAASRVAKYAGGNIVVRFETMPAGCDPAHSTGLGMKIVRGAGETDWRRVTDRARRSRPRHALHGHVLIAVRGHESGLIPERDGWPFGQSANRATSLCFPRLIRADVCHLRSSDPPHNGPHLIRI